MGRDDLLTYPAASVIAPAISAYLASQDYQPNHNGDSTAVLTSSKITDLSIAP
ncbi:MAG: hypothetical protein LBS60_02300 [Deltaproteobacteria bacterium]|jgi:hypothetical protein|nr:hypothetical protein [Deltaproteobacteria bacterium]